MDENTNKLLIRAVNTREWTPDAYHTFIKSLGLEDGPYPLFRCVCRTPFRTLKRALESGLFADVPQVLNPDLSVDEVSHLRRCIPVAADLEMINLHRWFWNAWIRSCSIGKPDIKHLEPVKRAFEDHFGHPTTIQDETDKWSLKMVYEINPERMNLALYIDLLCLVEPLLLDELRIYKRLRQCSECNDFYLQRDKRMRFCGGRCRDKWHNDRR